MAFELLERVSSYITPDFEKEISGQLKEPKEGVRKATSAIVPLLLKAFAERAAQDGGQSLLDEGRQVSANAMSTNIGPLFGNESVMGVASPEFVAGLFGGNWDTLSQRVATLSGIGTESVKTLFGILASPALTVLGKQTEEKGMEGPGLQDLLAKQQPAFENALPKELNDRS